MTLSRLLFCSLLLVAITPALSRADVTKNFHMLIDEEWEFELVENPLFATTFGDTRYNDRLPAAGLADERRREGANRRFLNRIEKIDRARLTSADQVNYDLLLRTLSDRVSESEFRAYLIPISNIDGFHIDFPQLPQQVPLATVTDYENYIKRLEGFHAYAMQHMERMRAGITARMVLPRIVLAGYEETISPHIVDRADESLLFEPFEKFADSISGADRARLSDRGRKAIVDSVVPGYRDLLNFMRDEYLPSTRETIAARDLPNGTAYYEYLVRSYTTLDLTPQQVHETGLAEVKRIRSEMQAVIDSTGFQGSLGDFVSFLRTDKRFYVETPEQLMKETAFVLKTMDGKLPGLFATLPRMSYGIKRIPDYSAPRNTTAYYNRPSGDGTRAGFYFVNCYNLSSRPLYEIEALSLHEAVPGHHLQVALAQELKGVPNFRRFGGFTAFVEGWALYSERLGLECGFYQDPYSNFGRLTYEMWRALRLVVDTGMHYYGWSRQQSIDFMSENSALTLLNITNEVDRYITWPGQALAYKTGELKIRELRAMAEGELGDRFDIRKFHDVVLGSGAVPLDVLDANVHAWVASIQSSN